MATISSEMAGTLLEWKVKEGDAVQAGDELCILESMKMEVPVTAAEAGTVKSLKKKDGRLRQ